MSNLQERLRNVFSILEEHNPHVQPPVWSISDSAVRVPGHSASESDEDVEDHNECLEVLRMVEDEEGEATMACKLPSSSARKAFNQEDEEDEFDRLACESLQRLRCRPKPALKTQVAERNIYDRMTYSTSPGSPICPANTPTLAQLAAPTPPNTHGSVRKKVRFREEDEFCDAPATEPADSSAAGPSPHLKQRLLSGDAAAKSPRESDAVADGSPRALVPVSGRAKTSYVPEHVRRPQAFTCYELDTPIVIGSGVDGSKDPLTEASASEQAVLGSSPERLFQGIQGSSQGNQSLQGCLKQSHTSNSVAVSDRRFAGLPEAEYLRASGYAMQSSGAGGAGDTPHSMGLEDDAERPEMVEFVPGKSSKARARNDLSAEALQALQSGSTTSAASTATNAAPAMNSHREQRSRGALSVPAADDDEDGAMGDVVELDTGVPTGASGVQCMQPMQLSSGSMASLGLTQGLDALEGLKGLDAKPVTMKDSGMVFEFPMDSSQRAVEGVGLFGGGVGFVSAPATKVGQKNRRGRRHTDE